MLINISEPHFFKQFDVFVVVFPAKCLFLAQDIVLCFTCEGGLILRSF